MLRDAAYEPVVRAPAGAARPRRRFRGGGEGGGGGARIPSRDVAGGAGSAFRPAGEHGALAIRPPGRGARPGDQRVCGGRATFSDQALSGGRRRGCSTATCSSGRALGAARSASGRSPGRGDLIAAPPVGDRSSRAARLQYKTALATTRRETNPRRCGSHAGRSQHRRRRTAADAAPPRRGTGPVRVGPTPPGAGGTGVRRLLHGWSLPRSPMHRGARPSPAITRHSRAHRRLAGDEPHAGERSDPGAIDDNRALKGVRSKAGNPRLLAGRWFRAAA